MNSGSCAYLDESMRPEAGIYVLAAVLVPDRSAAPYRAALQGLLMGRQPRLHWRDEGPKRRLEIAYALTDLSLDTIAVVGTEMPASKQKRARRKCMERLYWRLGRRDVHRVIMESRGAAGNKEDLDMVNALRARRMLANDLHVAWGDPRKEALLWLPDIIAGVVASGVTGHGELLEILSDGLVIDRLGCA
ncbi:hypothetical protein [Sphaerisporangium aureirubrum]|uniref:DUF3800 domain-containing protein n=1 Tax=Sphaerisporangium aureirubrum TaxID=1544736 RepID=A0ABW1NDR5_9ACTN